MSEKKQSANWVIALIHFISVAPASLILSYIFVILIGVLPSVLLESIGMDALLGNGIAGLLLISIATMLSTILGMWLSVRFSAKHINRAYIIKDIQKVIKLSTLYMVAIGTPYILFSIHIGPIAPDLSAYIFVSVLFITALATFYVVSKRYIKNDEAAIPEHIIDKKISTAISIIIVIFVAAVAVIAVLPKIRDAIEIGTF